MRVEVLPQTHHSGAWPLREIPSMISLMVIFAIEKFANRAVSRAGYYRHLDGHT